VVTAMNEAADRNSRGQEFTQLPGEISRRVQPRNLPVGPDDALA
jgi:hypothetical protein